MTRNRTIALIAAIAALVLAGVWFARKADTVNGTAGEAGSTVKTSGQALVGGPFTLTDQTGKTVTDQDFRGKYMLIFFGFTFCPDVCPTELQIMAGAIDRLGDKGADVVPVFVTVDPDRDTPEALARYVQQFHPRLVGLTGTHEQIAAIAKAYRVYYQKVKEEGAPDDSYTMDHSSVAYLMGPDGKFLAFFPPGVTPDQMAEKIASFL
jgi:protein SCO1/2